MGAGANVGAVQTVTTQSIGDSVAPRRGFDPGRVHRIPGAPARSASGVCLRHRLVVAAPTVAEVVRYTGGWLFDRMASGWDVLVLTAEGGDVRPLHILGAEAVGLEAALASPLRGPRPQAVAVAADLYRSDHRVRTRLDEALGAGLADARIWESGESAEQGDAESAARYTPSCAARAFKRQALVAAALPAGAGAHPEVFRRLSSVRSLATV